MGSGKSPYAHPNNNECIKNIRARNFEIIRMTIMSGHPQTARPKIRHAFTYSPTKYPSSDKQTHKCQKMRERPTDVLNLLRDAFQT